MPNSNARHVSLSSFRRAMTYSFGSIAEGSLIVAILDMIKAALNIIYNEQASSGDAIGACVACCASCILGCVRGLVDYFNRYAYIEIAMWVDALLSTLVIADRGRNSEGSASPTLQPRKMPGASSKTAVSMRSSTILS